MPREIVYVQVSPRQVQRYDRAAADALLAKRPDFRIVTSPRPEPSAPPPRRMQALAPAVQANGTDHVAAPARKLPKDAGVLVTTEGRMAHRQAERLWPGIKIVAGVLGDALPFERTLIWDGRTPLRVELVASGFGLLDAWELAVPLVDQRTLADDEKNPADRQRTQAVIGDLRVHLYETNVLFVRRTERIAALLREFSHQRAMVTNERLAFLVALYAVKPRWVPLPPGWVQGRAA